MDVAFMRCETFSKVTFTQKFINQIYFVTEAQRAKDKILSFKARPDCEEMDYFLSQRLLE